MQAGPFRLVAVALLFAQQYIISMTRAVLALFLSLALALTSHSVAVAKSAPAAVDQIVICSGFGATVIYTDADGQPTSAPHLCPDCIVHLDAGILPAFDMSPEALVVSTHLTVRTDDAVIRAKPLPNRPVRAPPSFF